MARLVFKLWILEPRIPDSLKIGERFFGAGETRHFTNGGGEKKKEKKHYDSNADSLV